MSTDKNNVNLIREFKPTVNSVYSVCIYTTPLVYHDKAKIPIKTMKLSGKNGKLLLKTHKEIG